MMYRKHLARDFAASPQSECPWLFLFGRLSQEFNNGELELEAVNSICFKFADGSITDDTGSPMARVWSRKKTSVEFGRLKDSSPWRWNSSWMRRAYFDRNHYPLVNKHRPWKSPICNGNKSSNPYLPGSMLIYQRVLHTILLLHEFMIRHVRFDQVQLSNSCFSGQCLQWPGVFKFPPRECMQKVAALYSLALQVLMSWCRHDWMTRSPALDPLQ